MMVFHWQNFILRCSDRWHADVLNNMDKLQMAVLKVKVLDQTSKLLVESYDNGEAGRVGVLNG